MQKATSKQYHSTTGETRKKGEKKTVQKRREDFERNHKICISHPPTLNFRLAMKLSGTRNFSFPTKLREGKGRENKTEAAPTAHATTSFSIPPPSYYDNERSVERERESEKNIYTCICRGENRQKLKRRREGRGEGERERSTGDSEAPRHKSHHQSVGGLSAVGSKA
jgi:hypothetical protein